MLHRYRVPAELLYTIMVYVCNDEFDDYYERYYYTYPIWRCSSQKDTSPTNDGPFMGKADPDVAWHPTYMGEGKTKCPSHFVYETAVKQSFMEMLYAIKRDHEENGENAWIDSEFRMVYQKVQEHIAERDSSKKAELDEQIQQLEEKITFEQPAEIIKQCRRICVKYQLCWQ